MLAVVAVGVGGLALPQVANAPKAQAFGTLDSSWLGQSAEHEMITRAALACAPGVKSTGDCFEPESMAQLAGRSSISGTGSSWGAVGIPDLESYVKGAGPDDDSDAHCDDADYLAIPGYDAKETSSTPATMLEKCIAYLKGQFQAGIAGAEGMITPSGDLVGSEVALDSDCTFLYSLPGEAKCDAIEGLGRALHGAQDFYAHSNWSDQAAPGPTGLANPPGLGLTTLPAFLDFRAATLPPTSSSFPAGLITGFYGGLATEYKETRGSEPCQGGPDSPHRVTHACLNKDDAKITLSATPGQLPTVTDPKSVRGKIGNNEVNAVDLAIEETQRQWGDFQTELRHEYGDARGERMILAMTQDVPEVDVVFAVDTTGSMGDGIGSAVAEASSIEDYLSGQDSAKRLVDYRVGLVDYKDAEDGCDYDADTDLAFSQDRAAILAAFQTLPEIVYGGCDLPEDVLSGVQRAVDFPWRDSAKKAIVVLGDAPGHDPETHSGLTSSSVIYAATHLDPPTDDPDPAQAISPIHIFPVVIGDDPDAVSFMTNLADGTGGEVFSADAASGLARRTASPAAAQAVRAAQAAQTPAAVRQAMRAAATAAQPSDVGQSLLDAIIAIADSPVGGDSTPPKVTLSFPKLGSDGYYSGSQVPVTGSVTASDASGVASIDCQGPAGGFTLGPLVIAADGTASRSVTVSGDGVQVITCSAVDASPLHNAGTAGDSEFVAVVPIDNGAPTVGCSVSPSTLPTDGSLVPVTATVTVDDAVSGPAGFTLTSVTSSEPDNDGSIQGFVPGTASTSGSLRAESTSGAGRIYTLTYLGKDVVGNTASCSATVTVPPTPSTGTVAVDAWTTRNVRHSTGVLASAPITTAAGHELLLAFVSSDGPAHGTQQVTGVTGGGLTWTPAARANGTKGTGTAEVWQAYANGPLTKATVKAAVKVKGYNAAITVVSYTGAASAVGVTTAAGATRGPAVATLTTTGAGSQVWAVGHDWSHAVAQQVLAGQSLLTQYLDKEVNDTDWVQYTTAVAGSGTAVPVGVSAPTADRWELAAVEIRAA